MASSSQTQAAKRKRGRPPINNRQIDDDIAHSENSPQLSAKGRKRERLQNAAPEAEIEQPAKKKRGRPSNAEKAARNSEDNIAIPTSQSSGRASYPRQPTVNKVGQRRRINATNADSQPDDAEGSSRSKRARRSISTASKAPEQHPSLSIGRRPKKQHQRETSHDDSEDEVDELQYQHLQPLTRQVPQHIIVSKWSPLPTAAVTKVIELFHDAERPVTMRLQDERKRLQASTAVQMVIRRLGSKLTKGIPFPPSTRAQRDEDFDFERILDSSRALEAQLTPMLHSIELLKAERRKEEERLAQDTERLEILERDAKAAEQRRRRASKKVHPVLHEDLKVKHEELEDEAGLIVGSSGGPTILNVGTLQPHVFVSHIDNKLDLGGREPCADRQAAA
jgi:hypothetical protein